MKWYDGLDNLTAYKFFDEISQIPRVSGNEKKISDWLMEFAKARGLDAVQDKANNVIIRKDGAAGYEAAGPVILQTHMDMVGEKEEESTHDFNKDPIRILRDGDRIHADGTTLGADAGAGLGIILAILDDRSLKHPPLEAIFTTDEERDMSGAIALDCTGLKAKRYLSMDCSRLTAGGAGQRDFYLRMPRITRPIRNDECKKAIQLHGFIGGHSGGAAVLERGNANVILARILFDLWKKYGISIVEMTGGQDNICAIPRSAAYVICAPRDASSAIEKEIEKWQEAVLDEFGIHEPDATVSITDSMLAVQETADNDAMEALLRLLFLMPSGVAARNKQYPQLAESSINLAIIKTYPEEFAIRCNIRHVLPSRRDFLTEQMKALTEWAGGTFEITCDLPAWRSRPDSPFVTLVQKVYPEYKLAVSQGTSEPGVLFSKLPECEVLGVGPDVKNCHSPSEYVSAEDMKNMYERCCCLLAEMKE